MLYKKHINMGLICYLMLIKWGFSVQGRNCFRKCQITYWNIADHKILENNNFQYDMSMKLDFLFFFFFFFLRKGLSFFLFFFGQIKLDFFLKKNWICTKPLYTTCLWNSFIFKAFSHLPHLSQETDQPRSLFEAKCMRGKLLIWKW